MEYLPKPELAKLLSAMHAEQKQHHMLALVCFFTGARVSQALALRGIDILELDGRMSIRIAAKKRGDASVHALHMDVNPAFDMSPLVEMARNKGVNLIFGGLSRQYFNICLKDYAALVGLPEDYAHSHIFRHSAAMVIMNATQRVGAVSRFLGHKSPASAFVYLKENDGRYAQEVMDTLNLAEAQ